MNALPSLSRLKLSPTPPLSTTNAAAALPLSFPSQPHLPTPLLPSTFTLSATLESRHPAAPSPPPPPKREFDDYDEDETYGEVDRIIGSRALESGRGMEYLIEWKDEHAPTWVPSDYIAKDVVAEYETPWWAAALKQLIDSGDGRDVDAVDPDGVRGGGFGGGAGICGG